MNDASAFLVCVGSRGVVNWVEAEVDLAISPATTVGPFCPFPFSPRKRGSIALSSFANAIRASAIRSAKARNWRSFSKRVRSAQSTRLR